MRIGVYTEDDYLWQKINLAVSGVHTVIRIGRESSERFDVCLYDGDGEGRFEGSARLVRMAREGEGLRIPFSFGELEAAIANTETAEPRLLLGDRCAYLDGERIALTDVEYKLLLPLVRAEGEFVGREELIREVWGEGADGGVLNVYVHYLREKLERGEKVILSSRKAGYGIDKRFLRIERKGEEK